MELNINELDENLSTNNIFLKDNGNMYEQIPENFPVKVTKKANKVTFNNNNINDNTILRPMNQSIPKPYAKMVRPHVPEPKSQISYDDILNKLGMFVADGKLHLLENQTEQTKQQIKQQYSNKKQSNQQPHQKIQQQNQKQPYQPTQQQQSQQNSYIYNKYFSNETNDTPHIRVPKNVTEYKNMLINDLLQKQKIKQIKSTKLIMPNSNINYAPNTSRNLNQLFTFSNR
jgi:hypothetical protein